MNTPFVLAFSVLALLLAILITANVVSAAVVASYRRIGVLKSVGFTPAQVAAAYLIQIGIPAIGGAVIGTVLGNVWVLPVIGNFAIPGQQVAVPLWINLLVPMGMFVLAGLAGSPCRRCVREGCQPWRPSPPGWLRNLVVALRSIVSSHGSRCRGR